MYFIECKNNEGEIIYFNEIFYDTYIGRSTLEKNINNEVIKNDIIIPNNQNISRFHAKIQIDDSGYLYLIDLSSSQSTRLNEEIIIPKKKYLLGHGSVINICNYQLSLKKKSIQNEKNDLQDVDINNDGTIIPDNNPGNFEKLKKELKAEGIIINNEKMLKLYQYIYKIAGFNKNVIIIGETGSGKEHVARTIHKLSGRTGSFIPINMSAVSKDLFEALFFGTIKNVATGVRESPGHFLSANKGTLFLDEIGEMPIAHQPKLLRVLEEGNVYKVGSSEPIPVDVQIVTATNVDILSPEVRKKMNFREDLFYRLSGCDVQIPSLKERCDEIPLLAQHFMQLYRRSLPKNKSSFIPNKISANAIKLLREYHWPGNVRELKNVIEKSLLHAEDSTLYPEDLVIMDQINEIKGFYVDAFLDDVEDGLKPFERSEREIIKRALEKFGSKSKTAKKLGIQRQTLDKKIERYKL